MSEWQGGYVGDTYYGPDDPPPERDDSVTVLQWSLHRLKGKPTLKMECRGDKVYMVGDVINQDDFGWVADRDWSLRGVVADVRVAWQDGEMRQHLEIEVTAGTVLDNVKKTGVVKSMTQSADATNAVVKQAQAIAKAAAELSQPIPPMPKPGERKFHFDD
jgi:hypothetical protein